MLSKSVVTKIVGSIALLALVVIGLNPSNIAWASSGSASVGVVSANGVTVTPSGPDATAARAWTQQEMLAAKPYPMDAGVTSVKPVASLSGPTGPAGVVAAGMPQNSNNALSLGDSFVSLPGVDTLADAYSYPPPYTRQDLRQITTPYSSQPFTKTGKLFFRQDYANWVCSAAVIGTSYASHAIITAGHCINDGNNGLSSDHAGWSYNMVFIPAYNNGIAPYGQWTIIYSTERAFTSWTYGGDLARDVAGAKLNKLGGYTITQKLGWWGFAWDQDRVNSWWEMGYPAEAPFTGKYMISCESSYAYDSPFGTTPVPMGVGCDETGGTSGGPWVMRMGTGSYINSVNSHRRTGYDYELYGPYFDDSVHTDMFTLLVAP